MTEKKKPGTGNGTKTNTKTDIETDIKPDIGNGTAAGTERIHMENGYDMTRCYSKVAEWEERVSGHPMRLSLD